MASASGEYAATVPSSAATAAKTEASTAFACRPEASRWLPPCSRPLSLPSCSPARWEENLSKWQRCNIYWCNINGRVRLVKINYEPPVMNKELLIRQLSHVSLMLHKDPYDSCFTLESDSKLKKQSFFSFHTCSTFPSSSWPIPASPSPPNAKLLPLCCGVGGGMSWLMCVGVGCISRWLRRVLRCRWNLWVRGCVDVDHQRESRR